MFVTALQTTLHPPPWFWFDFSSTHPMPQQGSLLARLSRGHRGGFQLLLPNSFQKAPLTPLLRAGAGVLQPPLGEALSDVQPGRQAQAGPPGSWCPARRLMRLQREERVAARCQPCPCAGQRTPLSGRGTPVISKHV